MMQRLSMALHLRGRFQKNERTVFYLLMEHELMGHMLMIIGHDASTRDDLFDCDDDDQGWPFAPIECDSSSSSHSLNARIF